MKRKNEAGFSMIEILAAMALLAVIIIPVCTSLVLSLRINAKADAVMQARFAVSSAVEELMAKGYSDENADAVTDKYDVNITVTETVSEPDGEPGDDTILYYNVIVSCEDLATADTFIRPAEPAPIGGGSE